MNPEKDNNEEREEVYGDLTTASSTATGATGEIIISSCPGTLHFL